MTNIHFCQKNKFIFSFIHIQKSFASYTKNKYYLIGELDKFSDEFLSDNVNIITLKELKLLLTRLDFTNCHQVILHSLPNIFRKHILPLIPAHILVTWIFYGYEYYHRRNTIENYLGTRTRSYYQSWSNPHSPAMVTA